MFIWRGERQSVPRDRIEDGQGTLVGEAGRDGECELIARPPRLVPFRPAMACRACLLHGYQSRFNFGEGSERSIRLSPLLMPSSGSPRWHE